MELDSLYQEIILDHYRHPRNYGPIKDSDVFVDEENPTCGDHIRLALIVKNGIVSDIRFDGKGCAISTASSSMMTECIAGKAVAEADNLAAYFLRCIRGDENEAMDPDKMGDLVALEGVKQFPVRVKCATMSWHALQKALKMVSHPSLTGG